MTGNRTRWGLPYRPFLYTLDQIADMFGVSLADIDKYIFYDGITTGVAKHDRVMARNIAPAGESYSWRVEEKELVRWMRSIGFTPTYRSGGSWATNEW